jgi:16S rRNA U516 pseudouridylate synthase RsuA-like enzyme
MADAAVRMIGLMSRSLLACVGVQPKKDRQMEDFIPRENIRWFKQQLEICMDESKREQLRRLLAAAEAELRTIGRS